ncbi:MAG: TetR/AcrR family transcriptional regulator [Oscillospiraceae bacterium]|nr:TetR/AcrR family transcriptional regulator [Oscillospiraceae bacterium]MCD8375001.1 TetR/AcrR family transcriptional regulator [Oscillospiraceae bacterium]
MRTVKNAQVRKEEILDAALRLFYEKGYAKTTVEDIMRECSIAKGTLYYHFKSKEEILSAMIERQLDRREERLRGIAEDAELSAVEKLVRAVRLLGDCEPLAGLHESENAELHHKSFCRSLPRFAPVATEIVQQGIASGEFSTPYPRESVELLLCASQLSDPGAFTWTQTQRRRRELAFFLMLERTLGISPEAKARLYELAGISEETENG